MMPGDIAWRILSVREIRGYAISGGCVAGDLPGVSISVEVGTIGPDWQFVPDVSWGVSRLTGIETGWTVDSAFKAKSMYPLWCHGEGSRCSDVVRKVVKHEPLVLALDETARTMTPYNGPEIETPDPDQGKLF